MKYFVTCNFKFNDRLFLIKFKKFKKFFDENIERNYHLS